MVTIQNIVIPHPFGVRLFVKNREEKHGYHPVGDYLQAEQLKVQSFKIRCARLSRMTDLPGILGEGVFAKSFPHGKAHAMGNKYERLAGLGFRENI